MIKQSVTLEETIEFLNQVLGLSQEAITKLFFVHIPCSEALAEHPSVQVRGTEPCVGLLGILNGLFGCDEEGWGPIAAVVDQSGIIRFERTRY